MPSGRVFAFPLKGFKQSFPLCKSGRRKLSQWCSACFFLRVLSKAEPVQGACRAFRDNVESKYISGDGGDQNNRKNSHLMVTDFKERKSAFTGEMIEYFDATACEFPTILQSAKTWDDFDVFEVDEATGGQSLVEVHRHAD